MGDTFHVLTPRAAPGLLSLVIPVYNERESIPYLVKKIKELLDVSPSSR